MLTDKIVQLRPYIENIITSSISRFLIVNFASYIILFGEDNYINFFEDSELNFSQNINNYTTNNLLNNSPLVFDKIIYN